MCVLRRVALVRTLQLLVHYVRAKQVYQLIEIAFFLKNQMQYDSASVSHSEDQYPSTESEKDELTKLNVGLEVSAIEMQFKFSETK